MSWIVWRVSCLQAYMFENYWIETYILHVYFQGLRIFVIYFYGVIFFGK